MYVIISFDERLAQANDEVSPRLLWTTWLMVTIYDVRYTSDSVFERICRAIHLGVMVGFAEFGTSFDPEDQIKTIFQTLSLFLAVSRFTLAVQYGVVAFQIRKYAYGKRPMITTASLHLIAAAIYFGISFRYDEGRNSRVYIMWVSSFWRYLPSYLASPRGVCLSCGEHLPRNLTLSFPSCH